MKELVTHLIWLIGEEKEPKFHPDKGSTTKYHKSHKKANKQDGTTHFK